MLPAVAAVVLTAPLLVGCGDDQTGDVAFGDASQPPLVLARRIELLLEDPSQLPTEASQSASAGRDAGLAQARGDDGGETDAGSLAADGAGEIRADALSASAAGEDAADSGAASAGLAAAGERPGDTDTVDPPVPPPTRTVRNPRPRSPRRTPRRAEPAPAEPEISLPPPTPGLDATDLYYAGKRKLEARDAPGAIADLAASLAARSSVRTMALLGRAYFDAGQLSRAEAILRKADSYPDAMLLLAQLYQQQGKLKQAKQVYKNFIERHPGHPKTPWAQRMGETL